MYLQLTLSELTSYLSDAIDAGISSYEQSLRPKGDLVKQAEVKRYLASKGARPHDLHTWVEQGLVHAQKTSEAQNASVYYSITEVKRVMCAIKLKQLYNDSTIRQQEAASRLARTYTNQDDCRERNKIKKLLKTF